MLTENQELILENALLLNEGKMNRAKNYIADDFSGKFNVNRFKEIMKDAVEDEDADALKNLAFILNSIVDGDILSIPRRLQKIFSKASRREYNGYKQEARALLSQVESAYKKMEGNEADLDKYIEKRRRQQEMAQQAVMIGVAAGAGSR